MNFNKRLIISDPEATIIPSITTNVVPLVEGGTRLVVEAILLVLVTSLWTILRLWSRRLKRVSLAVEDWLHIASLIFFYGLAVAIILSAITGGAGHHLKALQPWHVVRYSEIIFSIEFLYAFSTGLAKISIALMIMRIFTVRHVRIAGICIILLSSGWMIHPFFTGLLLCTPIEANWNPATPGASCGNQYIGFGIVAGLDIINELALLILPIPSLLTLQLRTRYKVALLGVFGTGLITLIITILRIPILLTTDFHDLTFDTRNQQIVMAEPAAALVVSCSPVLRPLFDKLVAQLMGRARQKAQPTASPYGFGSSAGRSVKMMKKSRGYTSFGDSQEYLELDHGVSSHTGTKAQTFVAACTNGIEERLGTSPRNTSNSGGILVRKETIVVEE
ncbi:hypothetical protein F4680DRAFT_149791 [Xylaria scruposa]|nr:hypothetical protein F4680DRAFT_149791 [Xylaria scruposa]